MEAIKTTLAIIGVFIDDMSDLADSILHNDTCYVIGLVLVGALLGCIVGVEASR